MTQRNEPAERLRALLRSEYGVGGRYTPKEDDLDAALAEQSRATVERIRQACDKVEEWNSDQTASYLMTRDVWAILDEEARASQD